MEETLYDKIKRLERLANPVEQSHLLSRHRQGRERFVTKSTAAPATTANHIIPMRQELFRLREGLNEALYELKQLAKIR